SSQLALRWNWSQDWQTEIGLDYAAHKSNDYEDYPPFSFSQHVYQDFRRRSASIFTTGTPMVAGRRLSIGFGAEYNRDTLTNAFTLNGAWHRDYRSVYGEARVPIVEGDGRQSLLELDVAGRWDDYSDFGSSTNPKVALTWRPTSDNQISATWGQGFRAPTLYNL